MSGFTADWLALRRPADTAARSRHLTDRLVESCTGKTSLRILDLCAGSGANMHYLSPHLRQKQHWLLLDHDEALLAHVGTNLGNPELVTCETLCCDLAQSLDQRALSGVDIVTASAAVDLVSADWFDRLAERCRDARSLVLFVLSYDGRILFEPADPFDATARDLLNRHQGTDKGFGPALGPAAPGYMTERLRTLGYRVETATSDWRLGPDQAELQRALIAGYADAAGEIAPETSARLDEWRERRLAAVAAGQARLVVGHVDLLAYP